MTAEEADFTSIIYAIEQLPTQRAEQMERIVEGLAGLSQNRNKREARHEAAALQHAMRAYRWVRQVTYSSGVYREIIQPALEVGQSADDRKEQAIVARLLDFMRSPGALSRVKRCETCNTWFFGRRNKRFCGNNNVCKQRNHDQQRRAEKAEYMRLHRKRKKEAEERQNVHKRLRYLEERRKKLGTKRANPRSR